MADVFACDAARIDERPSAHEALRQAGPVVPVEAPAGGRAWVVTDDALARQVLSDARFAKDPGLAPEHWHGRDPSLEPPAAHVRSVTTVDGAEHRGMRRVLAPVFTRRRVTARQDQVAAIARRLLTELAEESARTGRPADLVARFTTQFPLLVVCDLLEVPVDADRAARTVAAMTAGDAASGYTAFAELEAMVTEAMGAGTVVGTLTERAGTQLGDVSAREIGYLVTGLVFAGQVTTESFLGFLLAHYLAGHVDPATGADAYVTEALRLHPPAPFTLWRFTTTEVELAGTRLPAGAPVLVDIEGIDTDPARHRDPDELDPGRPRLPVLTFGDGPHACIGAQLAQLEARTVVDVLRADFPGARLAVPFDELRRDRSGGQARRLTALPAWLRPL